MVIRENRKKIKESSNMDNEKLHSALDSIENIASQVGYRVEGQGFEITKLVPEKDQEFMPPVDVVTRSFTSKDGFTHYDYACSVVFPPLTYNDSDYYDTIEYWIGRWQKVGSMITYVQKAVIKPENWEDDDE